MRQRISLLQAIVLFALMIAGVAGLAAFVYAAFIILFFATIDPKLGTFCGAVVAGIAILWVIRRANRRHDPHHAKWPPDPP
jgi:hypothetical protein